MQCVVMPSYMMYISCPIHDFDKIQHVHIRVVAIFAEL